MNGSNEAALPITWGELKEHEEEAGRRLQRVSWTPRADKSKPKPGVDIEAIIKQHTGGGEDTVSVVEIAKSVSGAGLLMQEDVNVVLHILREGLQVAGHLVKLYGKNSNLVELQRLNRGHALTGSEQQTEFNEKQLVAGAIAVFVLSRYVRSQVGSYKAEEVSDVNVDFTSLPELALQSPSQAISCLLYYYGKALELGAKDGLQFVRLTDLYFRRAIEELRPRVEHLRYAEPFTEQAYILEGEKFNIHGFDVSDLEVEYTSIEFAREEFSNIVGNRLAKHMMRRLIERVLCFDMEEGKNPMLEIGALSTVHMFHGLPGGGKTMMIRAAASTLYDLCKERGIPFLYHPLPGNIISSFQGKSAEAMENWFVPIRDARRIVLAPIDDAENALEDRGGEHISEGAKGTTNSFLRNTEGAAAINRGNALILIATNVPDKIDPAVRSRVQTITLVPGAESREDVLDQNELWRRRYDRIEKGLLQLGLPDYEYMSAQAELSEAGEAMENDHPRPKDARFKQAFEAALKEHEPNEEEFYAKLILRVQVSYPWLRSRDLRNIQNAVDSRIFDFDLPEKWSTDLDVFHRQPYGRKKELIDELLRERIRTLNPARIRLQETVHYIDQRILAVDEGRRRRIEERTEQMAVHREAEELFAKLHGGKK